MSIAVLTPATCSQQARPQPECGPFVRHGGIEEDVGYEADLARYVAEIVRLTGCPNIAAFCSAQSRLEVGHGKAFSTHLNFANIGNTDSDPTGGGGFDTPEHAAAAWHGFIWNGSPGNTYTPFITAVQAGEADVLALARLIKGGGYATDPDYAEKIATLASRAG